MKVFAASKFDMTPTPYTETGIGVYATCDAPVTELNQVGITLGQDFDNRRKWLTISLDKATALELASELTRVANKIADNAPEPDLRGFSWNLLTGKPNYTMQDVGPSEAQ